MDGILHSNILNIYFNIQFINFDFSLLFKGYFYVNGMDIIIMVFLYSLQLISNDFRYIWVYCQVLQKQNCFNWIFRIDVSIVIFCVFGVDLLLFRVYQLANLSKYYLKRILKSYKVNFQRLELIFQRILFMIIIC